MSFLPSYCFASINMMSMVLPYSSVIIIDIIKLIISMVIPLFLVLVHCSADFVRKIQFIII